MERLKRVATLQHTGVDAVNTGSRLWHRPDIVGILVRLADAVEVERAFVSHALTKHGVWLIASEDGRRSEASSRVPADHVCLPVRDLSHDTCAQVEMITPLCSIVECSSAPTDNDYDTNYVYDTDNGYDTNNDYDTNKDYDTKNDYDTNNGYDTDNGCNTNNDYDTDNGYNNKTISIAP